MANRPYFTGESFGSDTPKNWEEIASALNEHCENLMLLDPDQDEDDLVNCVWEAWCAGRLVWAPAAEF